MSLFDEFGNPLGYSDDDESESVDVPTWDATGNGGGADGDESDVAAMADDADDAQVAPTGDVSQAIVLHEDKQYYADAETVFGDAEVLVEDEDQQTLDEPLVAPGTRAAHAVLEDDEFEPTSFSKQFLVDLQKMPERVRCVAFAGHLHHGKTSFIDLLVQQTHEKKWSRSANVSLVCVCLCARAHLFVCRVLCVCLSCVCSARVSHKPSRVPCTRNISSTCQLTNGDCVRRCRRAFYFLLLL